MTVLAVAHRAGNSLAGLHEANVLGVDVIEADVHAHRGRLEVRHLKTAGPLPFLWDRWELVPAGAPRLGLDELLAAERRGATFMLDLKGRHDRVGRHVALGLHQHPGDDPVLVCGRSWPSVDHVAEQVPYVRPVLSARTRSEVAALRRRLDTADPPPYGVSLHSSLLTSGLVEQLTARVALVMTWPVNDHAALDRVLALGANAVISDDPEVLRTVVGMRP